MSSKNDILSAIRRHTGKRYDMPELTLDAITYEDKILQFTDSLKAAGGQVVLMQPETISTILFVTIFLMQSVSPPICPVLPVPPLIRTISTILVSWTIQTLPSWKAILV